MNDPVVLSEEPASFKVNIDDPSKPKAVVTNVKKLPSKNAKKDKLIQAFFGNEVNSENLGEHIIKEYAEPTAKRMANNAIQSILHKLGDAAQMLLFGKIINKTNGPVDYTSYSNPNVGAAAPVAHKLTAQVEQFAFTSRQDATRVLDLMKGKIATYGSVSVLDYYEAVGEPVDYMMANRGWLDLSTAEIKIAPEGFIIELPRPIALKR